MKHTEKYSLLLPEETDYFDVEHQNENMVILEEELFTGTLHPYVHEYSGVIHKLTGKGPALRFKATADYLPGESFTVNGQPVAAVTLDGYPLPAGSFKAGVWVLAVLDGERLTFQFRAKLGDGTGLTWGELDSL